MSLPPGLSQLFTTSWDDGYPADLKLAALLSKHSVRGTFYVPRFNSEKRPVMSAGQIREVAMNFEIGAHTLDHVVLTTMSSADALWQMAEGKHWLEDTLGSPVRGFCYPRGKFSRHVKTLAVDSGFNYARTVENFRISSGTDRFEMPTTIQFFPHAPSVYLRNFLQRRPTQERAGSFARAIGASGLVDRVCRMADFCVESGSTFHLWGHSWEIEQHNLWEDLETALAYVTTLSLQTATNQMISETIS